jgi:hypothetical protein
MTTTASRKKVGALGRGFAEIPFLPPALRQAELLRTVSASSPSKNQD